MPVMSCSSINKKANFAGHVIITTIIMPQTTTNNIGRLFVERLFKTCQFHWTDLLTLMRSFECHYNGISMSKTYKATDQNTIEMYQRVMFVSYVIIWLVILLRAAFHRWLMNHGEQEREPKSHEILMFVCLQKDAKQRWAIIWSVTLTDNHWPAH